MSDQTNLIIKQALDVVQQNNPTIFVAVDRATVETSLQSALQTVLPTELTLQSDKPDFEAIFLQLVQELQTDPAWKDAVPSGVGMTLLRDISGGISLLHNAVIRSAQINYLRPGTPKSSVYALMNTLGVNPRRKVPAKLNTQITIPDRDSQFVIPKFTQFSIQGQDFYNPEDVVYTEFELSQNVLMYQGTRFEQTGTAAGIPYETIEIGYENFAIAEDGVFVYINGEQWTQAKKMIWNVPSRSKEFFASTLETGNVEIKFGNDAFGKRLTAGDTIKIVWFETRGKSASLVNSGIVFDTTYNAVPLACVTTGSTYGADDELDKDYYINTGPFLRSSENGAVTRNQYADVACNYPLVRDALFRGQAQIAPGKRNWMNVVEATILTESGTLMNNNEWISFVAYMQDNSISNIEVMRRNPFILPVKLKATVHCNSKTMLDQVKKVLTDAVMNFNRPRRGAIGFSLYRSDILGILEGNIINSPLEDLDSMIEYVTHYYLEYGTGFNTSTLIEGTKIDEEMNAIADYYTYVKIESVDLTCIYTPRRSVAGRRDLELGD